METRNSCSSWDQVYLEAGQVYSISQDPIICDQLYAHIPTGSNQILIPGCGSQTYLQRHIHEKLPLARNIYCTDWSAVAIQQAQECFSAQNIGYLREDSTCLGFPNQTFDAVVICNSVLAPTDDDNQKMISEFWRVLRQGGVMVGLFPTIFSAVDISINFEEKRKWQTDGTILLNEAMFREETQDMRQVFPTPLQLHKMLKKMNFTIKEFSICFLDSDVMLKEGERIYGVPAALNLPVWELFVVAVK